MVVHDRTQRRVIIHALPARGVNVIMGLKDNRPSARNAGCASLVDLSERRELMMLLLRAMPMFSVGICMDSGGNTYKSAGR